MLRLQVRKYLFDILQACDLILSFTSSKGLADYSADALLRSAVERQFEIAGEALHRALRLDPLVANYISDTRRITAFRNRLVHGYDSIADETACGVLESNLPALRNQVAKLLEQLNNSA